MEIQKSGDNKFVVTINFKSDLVLANGTAIDKLELSFEKERLQKFIDEAQLLLSQ